MGTVRVTTWRHEPAVELAAGDVTSTFLPDVSMLGVSLQHRGEEFLAPVAPLARIRTGHASGIPLLHPWANRLSAYRYPAPRTGRPIVVPRSVPHDENGLPIHGTALGEPFAVERVEAGGDTARLVAHFDSETSPLTAAAFPFPHRLTVTATVALPATLRIDTTLRPTSRRAVPASFGWHPYFVLPGTARSRWRMRLPPRLHATLDERSIPTGDFTREPEFDGPIGRRTFDDHYRLGGDRRFVLATPRTTLTIEFSGAYRYGQVFAPPGKPFACIEPMVATVNALRDQTAPLVAPGRTLRASFTLRFA